ncbi:MAG TPA: hypothetical protein VMI54_01450 [Polyangiaceae bacterium]|nr:hypothetical protein [Polyangiaceae bacterium]
MKPASAVLVFAVIAAAFAASCSGGKDEAVAREESAQCLSDAGALYQKKVAPVLASDQPQTCNECHLSGVDLNLFVRADMCETRACLVDLGLVDMQDPDDSKVLAWIEKAHPDSALITQDVIDQEYDAFKEFVEQIAKCGGEACPGVTCPATSDVQACGTPDQEPNGNIIVPPNTACDSPTIEATFRDTVYVWRDRCFPCHFASEPGVEPGAPPWIDDRNGCNPGSLETFHNVVSLGLVDSSDPTQSLILRKPLDISQGGVMHGGGSKFDGTDDPTYQSFLSFLEYWIGCGAPAP